ncbi:MAG: hypothetical protein C0429_06900 [Sphingopyxis sp.]|nr:hypothetical protein [Sphingopyxis sp.]
MTDRPILFRAPMVRALLAGTKTQTRRILNPQPSDDLDNLGDGETLLDMSTGEPVKLHFAVGDRLWVKETWGCHWATDPQKPSEIVPDLWSVRYFADDYIRPASCDGSVALLEQCKKKRVSIFMPRWASRLTLTVTDVRVERLQDCSENDAIAEGIQCANVIVDADCAGGVHREITADRYFSPSDPEDDNPFEYAVDAYHRLWNSINGEGAWEQNPWVVAVSFTVEQRNIDQ